MVFHEKFLKTLPTHERVVCPDCFVVLHECACGANERLTRWELCDICMKKKPELKEIADSVPEGLLLDARLVMDKILPMIDYPKEFIPNRLYPGYDQWRDKLVHAILTSTSQGGVPHERREDRADSGFQDANRCGTGGDAKTPPGESAGE